ncbi:hypothetical protein [Flavobacterium sp. 3HN19-14]|uniref:hypothetical protein n=1 Tax=Flavobacterium sp. 3HN19-14 TaxID=3448133 RepID=UPI003EE01DE8
MNNYIAQYIAQGGSSTRAAALAFNAVITNTPMPSPNGAPVVPNQPAPNTGVSPILQGNTGIVNPNTTVPTTSSGSGTGFGQFIAGAFNTLTGGLLGSGANNNGSQANQAGHVVGTVASNVLNPKIKAGLNDFSQQNEGIIKPAVNAATKIGLEALTKQAIAWLKKYGVRLIGFGIGGFIAIKLLIRLLGGKSGKSSTKTFRRGK